MQRKTQEGLEINRLYCRKFLYCSLNLCQSAAFTTCNCRFWLDGMAVSMSVYVPTKSAGSLSASPLQHGRQVRTLCPLTSDTLTREQHAENKHWKGLSSTTKHTHSPVWLPMQRHTQSKCGIILWSGCYDTTISYMAVIFLFFILKFKILFYP